MRLKHSIRREPPENTIPLINVVFLMLIFFLFAGSIARDDARKIEPPLNILEDETIRSTGALIIDTDGQTHFEDSEIAVGDWLAQQDQDPENGPLKIATDSSLEADKLEAIIKDLKSSGRSDIVLITRRGSK